MIYLFNLGKLYVTPGAIELFEQTHENMFDYIQRHATGDWGDLDRHDKIVNNNAVREGYRILSAYKLKNNQPIWIITEADRSATTILKPDEY